MTDNPGQAAPGWYPDPSGAPRQRYFDGQQWTEHYHDEAAGAAPAMGAAAAMAGGMPTAMQTDMGPVEYIKKVLLENYANFEGRARRAEFWWWTLAVVVVNIVLSNILGAISGFFVILGFLFALAVFIPGLGVTFRRLHDTNRSGWWILIGLIPLVGAIILIVFLATDSDRSPNQYGPSPKY